MRHTTFAGGLISLAGVLALAQTPAQPSLVIHNARIYTMDARRPTADAIAVRGDRIIAVGTSGEVLLLKGSETRVIDARQATIVPGLHDSHGHFTGLGATLQTLNFRGTTSYRQIVDMVRERAAKAAPGEWIVGRSWDQNDWSNKDWPTHEALSAASPNNPVYLTRVDGHAGLANRKALELAALSKATADPAGGRILRDASGEPSGVLIDNAQRLVASKIPPPTGAQLEAQVLLADAETRRLGLTMVHDAGTSGEVVDVYKRLIDAGKLKTRLYVMLRGTLQTLMPFFNRGPVTDYGQHHLAVRSIKLVADGALGSRGAAMLEPYSDEPGTTGLLVTPPEEIYAQTLAASKAGFQTSIHAIGDRANRIALDVFERVQREVPGARDLRMRDEHSQILDRAEIPRFARLNVVASMQATHATSDMPWVPDRIGRARMEEGAYLWQTLLASGVHLANGSDFPVEEANPMLGIYAAITRQDPSGNPPGGWMPGQRMSREQALKSFTLDAAYAAHAEKLSGSLEPGKLADLVMLSADIMRVSPKEILGTKVLMTIVGGEVVHEQQGATAQTTGLPAADRVLARDVLQELIQVPTTEANALTRRAAQAMADRLIAVGIPRDDVRVLGPNERVGNLLARLRGRNPALRPVLLMAHIDVVPARREDWSFDPWTFLERDGWFYGRGTSDNKAGAAMLVANVIRLKREGWQPQRDVIVLLTGDEETSGASIQWLLAEHRALVDAELALNTDSGGIIMKEGGRPLFTVQASEKVYADYQLEVTDVGGHSSLVRAENPIYALAEALERIAAHRFPLKVTEVARIFFERSALIESGQLASDMRAVAQVPPGADAAARLSAVPFYNARLRTTCVATRVEAGHANNALPQLARANVNCRILPGELTAEVEATVRRLAGAKVKVITTEAPKNSPPSPVSPAMLSRFERLAAEQWPGIPVAPVMEAGATDGLYTRNAGIPTYGVSALVENPDDVRAHGKDERVGVEAFYAAAQFWYRMIKAFGTDGTTP